VLAIRGAAADGCFRRALSLAYGILACAIYGRSIAAWPRRAASCRSADGFRLLCCRKACAGQAQRVGTTARPGGGVRSSATHLLHDGEHRPFSSTVPPWVHALRGNVFRLAALSVFLMFLAVLLFFREPRRERAEPQLGDGARISSVL
jgi:hypothetical protein